ncbi:MAG: hypothetical protein M3Q10_19020 [Chloroflexota bacterium]|nr:hypothetical protein [Chloroflexota bacterium]
MPRTFVSVVEPWFLPDPGYFAGTGRMPIPLAGYGRIWLGNPARSGKRVVIYKFVMFGDATLYPHIYVDPTAGLPPASAARAVTPAWIGGAPSVAEFRSDASAGALSAGTGADAQIDYASPANAREVVDLPPVVLGPGRSIGLNVPAPTAAVFDLTMYWTEEAA